jgi:hypothetical protein
MTASLLLSDSLVIDENVAYRELDGEGILLHLERGVYFGLNHVGARMWALISEHGSLERVVAALADEFEASREELGRDLVALASDLAGKGLVHVAGRSQ